MAKLTFALKNPVTPPESATDPTDNDPALTPSDTGVDSPEPLTLASDDAADRQEDTSPKELVDDAPSATAPDSVEESNAETDETETDDAERDLQMALARHRRRRTLATLLAIAAAGGFLYQVNRPAVVTPTSLSDPATQPTASDEIQAVLQEAVTWKSAHASFTGFAPSVPAGVRIAAYGPAMVVSVFMGNTCLYSGVYPSGVKPILTDNTRSACTSAAIGAAYNSLVTMTVVP